MKIWAHRGCSQCYPENTITAFEQAGALYDRGLTGIELDIQLTRDHELVVIHDERIDRTTDGSGFVRDYTLAELRKFHIFTGTDRAERIPTMREVFDCLKEPMRRGLLLNIELKNSICDYAGLEEKIVALADQVGLSDRIIYSSFYAKSLSRLHELVPEAPIGVLDAKVSDCYYKARGLGFPAALHPHARQMDLPAEEVADYTVRAWFTKHLFPEKPSGTLLDLETLAAKGITDVFLNEPERYLSANNLNVSSMKMP